MAETAKKISMIPAKVQYDRNVKLSEKKMKVAAYCRVSTELEEQDSSYEAQLEYYTSKISENENWKNAGIYADDGKSGTNTKKRADFNAMIQDALAGKIDMILTKSVSRRIGMRHRKLLKSKQCEQQHALLFGHQIRYE